LWIDIKTGSFLEVLKKNQDELQMDWIISQFHKPIKIGIDLEGIYENTNVEL
jgi:hypothetical protein